MVFLNFLIFQFQLQVETRLGGTVVSNGLITPTLRTESSKYQRNNS